MKLKKLSVLLLALVSFSLVSCDKDEDESRSNGRESVIVDLTASLKDSYDGVLDLLLNKSNVNISFERVDTNLVSLKFNDFSVGNYDLGALAIDSVILSGRDTVRMDRDSQLVVLDLNKDGLPTDSLYISIKGEGFQNDSINANIYVYGIEAMGNLPLTIGFYTGKVEAVSDNNPTLGGEIWNAFDGKYTGTMTAEGMDSQVNIMVDKVNGYEVRMSVLSFPTAIGNLDLAFEKIVVVENEDGTCSFSGSMKYADLIDVAITGAAKEKNAIEFELKYATSIASFNGSK